MTEAWLTDDEAVELLRERYGVSIGKAEAMLAEARKSGEVRSTEVTGNDGLVRFDQVPGAIESMPSRRSKDDLVCWADQQITTKGRRYSSDADLVAEARKGMKEGRWPNKHQAALALAPRAEGQSIEAIVDRLARKI